MTPIGGKNYKNMDFGLSSLISGGISALAGLGGSYMSQKAVEKQNEGNMRLAQYQFDRNLEMWNKQNEYNNPVAQMQRLKDAGLNPNMVYGNGSAANQAGNAPQYQAPRLEAYTNFSRDFSGAADAFFQSQLTAQSIKNLEQQNEILKVDQKAKQQQIMSTAIQQCRDLVKLSGEKDDYEYLRKLTRYNAEAAEKNLTTIDKQQARLDADTELIKTRQALTSVQKLLTDEEIKIAKAKLPGIQADSSIAQLNYQQYRDYNIRPNDPLWARALVKVIDSFLPKDESHYNDRQKEIKRSVEEILNGSGEADWNDIKEKFPE